MTDQNQNNQPSTMGDQYGTQFERTVLYLLLTDSEYASFTYPVLDISMFETVAHQTIFEFAEYCYRNASGTFITFSTVFAEITSALRAMKKRSQKMEDYKDALKETVSIKKLKRSAGDIEYVREKTSSFVTRAKVKTALLDSVQDYEQGNFQQIITRIEEAVASQSVYTKQSDLGISFDSIGTRLKKYTEKRIATKHAPLGIPKLDKVIRGGLEPGNLGLILSPANRGKSLILAQAAVASLRKKYNVALITLELSEVDYAQRIDANISGIPVNEINRNTKKHLRSIMTAAQKHILGRLYIKKFMEDVTSVEDIRIWLQALRAKSNFTPDVIIVDYLDLLRHVQTKGQRPDIGITSRALRRLGAEFDAAVWSASQTNRGSYTSSKIELQDIAEDIQKVHVADIITGWAQSSVERQKNLGRLFLLKSRQSGSVGLAVDCQMRPEVMTLEQSAAQMTNNLMGRP